MTKNNFDERALTWDDDIMKCRRAQAVADSILQIVPLSERLRAFELGCGTGTLALMLQPHCHSMVLADTSEGMLSVLKSKIQNGGIDNITIQNHLLTEADRPAGTFELVYTHMTLHHITNYREMLQLFHAMLSPGGWLCIADLDLEDGSFHGDGFDVHHGFDRDDLRNIAELLGFAEIRFTTIFEIEKATSSGQVQRYPVFLMSCCK